MRSILVAFAVAAAFVTGSMAGAADYELKGLTTNTFDGDEGIYGFTLACQAEFGSDARMCNSIEVMETTNLPSLPTSGGGWVRPVVVAADSTAVRDASGHSFTPSLSCNSWSSASVSTAGLIFVDALGGGGGGTAGYIFAHGFCNGSLAVACCSPTPQAVAAAVPSLVPWGRGLLAIFMLSLAGGALLFRGPALLTGGARDVSPRR
jgi:hypothetical protein